MIHYTRDTWGGKGAIGRAWWSGSYEARRGCVSKEMKEKGSWSGKDTSWNRMKEESQLR